MDLEEQTGNNTFQTNFQRRLQLVIRSADSQLRYPNFQFFQRIIIRIHKNLQWVANLFSKLPRGLAILYF